MEKELRFKLLLQQMMPHERKRVDKRWTQSCYLSFWCDIICNVHCVWKQWYVIWQHRNGTQIKSLEHNFTFFLLLFSSSIWLVIYSKAKKKLDIRRFACRIIWFNYGANVVVFVVLYLHIWYEFESWLVMPFWCLPDGFFHVFSS